LCEGLGKDPRVVDSGVGSGVAGAQHHRGRFAGALGSVVDERAQRVQAEPYLERGGGSSFSECEFSRVASRSRVSGWSASTSVDAAIW
jgi:hypothetical protein